MFSDVKTWLKEKQFTLCYFGEAIVYLAGIVFGFYYILRSL